MTASIIDGKIISAEVRAEAKLEVERFVEQYKTKPCLAVVLVGENPASQVYVRTKSKMAKEIGMDVEDHIKQKDISEEHLIGIINELNNDKITENVVEAFNSGESIKDEPVGNDYENRWDQEIKLNNGNKNYETLDPGSIAEQTVSEKITLKSILKQQKI